ncbi:META domain-containing protein [Methylocystis sp. S23]|jgi:heat shock protein HslJ
MRFLAAAAFLLGSYAATTSLAASSSLAGRYRIVSVAGAEGFDAARTRAEFAANGRFASTIGCNRIVGAPRISGSELSFGPMAATRMACPPPLDRVERAYLEALRNVRGYRRSGKTLLLLGEGGETLVTLARAK